MVNFCVTASSSLVWKTLGG